MGVLWECFALGLTGFCWCGVVEFQVNIAPPVLHDRVDFHTFIPSHFRTAQSANLLLIFTGVILHLLAVEDVFEYYSYQ